MKTTIDDLKKELEMLPKGSLTKKHINGKTYYYLQWKENGKSKSKYIKEDEIDEIKSVIAHRNNIKKQIAVLKKEKISHLSDVNYMMNVTVSTNLKKLVNSSVYPERRNCYSSIEKFLYGKTTPRICSIYGLRRTGKTTLLHQLIYNMSKDAFDHSAYIKAKKGQTMNMLDKDLQTLADQGYKYIFIDEITFLEDFVDTASILSDIYAAMGLKIVISGTDSLGLWLANNEELYDRAYMVHTTWIPFNEHARLLNTTDIDDYISYGGTLRVGESDFDDPELIGEEASFRDDESTRKYIDTAICKNIQHSLRCYENGSRFMHLEELYNEGELTNAINRIIESMNHRFLLSVLIKDFKSNDLSLAQKNLLRERDLNLRTDILERIDKKVVTDKLKSILDIFNQNLAKIKVTEIHVREIKDYLKALDLIESCPIRYYDSNQDEGENILIMQPGMRYCQAKALVFALMKDKEFAELNENEKKYVTDKILDEVKGRMMEEIVLIETKKLLPKRYEVFKYQFLGGEFDMVIYDTLENKCSIFEIKHSTEMIKDQCKHLLNDKVCSEMESRIAPITDKHVIYRGNNIDSAWGIGYINVTDYLKSLTEV